MNYLVDDSNRFVVLLINDYYPEYGEALNKLSAYLGRPLKGIVLVDTEVKATGRNLSDPTGSFQEVVCDFSKPGSLRKAIRKFENNLLVVTSGSERNQPYLKRALPHLAYIMGPSESSLDWATHKATMRELLRSFNPDLVPKTQVIANASDKELAKVIERLKFPVIVKPNGLALSILVSRANNIDELKTITKRSFKVIQAIYSRDRGRGIPGMIVEEFMHGDMYSVDSYVDQKGNVWSLPLMKVTTAHSIGKEGFYGYRTDSNHTLTESEITAAHDVAAQAVHALGLRSCVGHIELFNTIDGWKVIELGPRAGGYRQDLYYLAYGIDHAYNELLVKIGLPPEIPSEPLSYSAAMNIYAEMEGVITALEGYEEAAQHGSVHRLTQHSGPGDVALNSGNGGKYIIDGILHNKDFNQLNADMEAIRQKIKIETKPLDTDNGDE